MLQKAFVPLCEVFEKLEISSRAKILANELLGATIKNFWSVSKGTYINNLPWLKEEKEERICDRSLAMAVLYDLCPDGMTKNSVSILANPPENLGLSYPANANWRYWALAKGGQIQPILNDFRGKWYDIESVKENNTIAEWWTVKPDNGQQWSHCAVSPLFVMFQNVAGIQPLAPAYSKVEIRPQLGDIDLLSLTYHTVKGPILFKSRGKLGNRTINIKLPLNVSAELVLPAREPMGTSAIIPMNINVPTLTKPAKALPQATNQAPKPTQLSRILIEETAVKRYKLEAGQEYQFVFKTV